MAEIIRPETDEVLRRVASLYSKNHRIQGWTSDTDNVARLWLDEGAADAETWIIVPPENEGLAARVQGRFNQKMFFVVVDFLPEGQPSSIVAPGFYDEEGNWDAKNGAFARPVVRPLFDIEGRAMSLDLINIMETRLPGNNGSAL